MPGKALCVSQFISSGSSTTIAGLFTWRRLLRTFSSIVKGLEAVLPVPILRAHQHSLLHLAVPNYGSRYTLIDDDDFYETRIQDEAWGGS